MDRKFWLERWQRGEIGFHQDEVNPHLANHWPQLARTPPGEIFIPLCGKSRDLLWLAGQGYRVLGVEISPLAVQAFFEENELTPQRSRLDSFERWQFEDITILLGDFFDLQPEHLVRVQAAYDRASLIALPPEMRARYARHLTRTLPAMAPVLLITLEYPQHEMNGPPFSVGEEEVHQLYDRDYNVDRLAVHDIWAQTPRFQAKGLSALTETVYRLDRK